MYVFQDIGQAHASILNGDPNIILGHAGQPQVTVSAAGQQIPVSQIIANQTTQGHGNYILILNDVFNYFILSNII